MGLHYGLRQFRRGAVVLLAGSSPTGDRRSVINDPEWQPRTPSVVPGTRAPRGCPPPYFTAMVLRVPASHGQARGTVKQTFFARVAPRKDGLVFELQTATYEVTVAHDRCSRAQKVKPSNWMGMAERGAVLVVLFVAVGFDSTTSLTASINRSGRQLIQLRFETHLRQEDGSCGRQAVQTEGL